MILAGTFGALMLSSYTATALYRWSAMALECNDDDLCRAARMFYIICAVSLPFYTRLLRWGLGAASYEPMPVQLQLPKKLLLTSTQAVAETSLIFSSIRFSMDILKFTL